MRREVLATKLYFATVLAAAMFALPGCVTQNIYLQNLHVDGPRSQPPVFISNGTREGVFRIVPWLSITGKQSIDGRIEGHSLVNAEGLYRTDTVRNNGEVMLEESGTNTQTFQGRNLRWNMPGVEGGLNFDYAFTRGMSLAAGFSYSAKGGKQFLCGKAGAGFSFEGEKLGGRIDLGAQWQSVAYRVDYAVVSRRLFSSTTRVQFFTESGQTTHAGVYGALTLNTKNPDWPANFFMQVGLSRQTLVDFTKPYVSMLLEEPRVFHSTALFTLSPGMYIDVSSTTRIMLGARFSNQTSLLDGEQALVIVPMFQLELGM